jgi:hypothetical protein
MTEYPSNVCVHGNGFVQVSLGGDPHETRIHVWHPSLPSRTQKVNTSTHNHRFGFTSTVLRGTVMQQELRIYFDAKHGTWTKWTAGEDRLPTGNRELVKQYGAFRVEELEPFQISAGGSYSMGPVFFHRTVPVTPVAVTLMTKTKVIPANIFQASVLCHWHSEPDQEYSRFQMPWPGLEAILMECLRGTPFDGEQPWA